MSGQRQQTDTSQKSKSETERRGSISGTGSTTPWGAQEQYWRDLYTRGWDAFENARKTLYSGDWVAGPTEAQRASIAELLKAAPGLSAGAEPLRAFATRVAGGEFLDPNNKILREGIAGVNEPILRQLKEEALPGVLDAAMRGGAYGGTANALANTQAINDWSTASLNNAAKMTLDWTNARMQDVFNTPELFNAANQLALAPGTVMGLAGDAERALNQLALDNDIAKYMDSISSAFRGFPEMASLLSAGGFRETEQDQTSYDRTTEKSKSLTSTLGPEADMFTQILQGLLGGSGMLSSLSDAFSTGGGLSSLLKGLGFLSDRRFKEDITEIGKATNGLPIYRFRYIGDPRFQIGFMADEVEKVRPEAVEEFSGIKYVDYYKATEML